MSLQEYREGQLAPWITDNPGSCTAGQAAWAAEQCRECGGSMQPGIAMQSGLTGTGDFHDADAVVTLSPGGPGHVVPVEKCRDCGWSVSTSNRVAEQGAPKHEDDGMTSLIDQIRADREAGRLDPILWGPGTYHAKMLARIEALEAALKSKL